MKRHRLNLILLLLFMFFLQGCIHMDLGVDGKIIAPKVTELPVQGTWKAEKYVGLDNSLASKDKDSYLGVVAAFDDSIALIGTETCISPEYKIKNVSAAEYFLYKYKVNPSEIGVKEENINVVTVSSHQHPFRDFIKVNDNSLLVYENLGFLYLNRVSDKVDRSIAQNTASGNVDEDEAKPDILLKSGVFLGLRSPGTVKAGSSYRTLWIASANREIRPVYEMKQLFVPRKTGFWELDYWSQKVGGTLRGTLYSHPVADANTDYSKNYNNLLEEDGRRDILFVGNDYIGTEFKYTDPIAKKETAKYQVLPIDNIGKGVGVNISDIAGEDGLNALIRSSQTYTMTLDKSKAAKLQKDPAGDNFSLSRRNGQWNVTGRLNYSAPVNGRFFEDYDIYLMPPQKLIYYDELKLPWNYIKERVPEALDIYTSPKKDVAIIITKGSLEVYTIENEKLSEKPVRSIALQKDESVIMAEWAVGDYADKWEDVIRPRASELTGNKK